MKKTLHVSRLPAGWNKYPYTLRGYRVNYSWQDATRSMFFSSNEVWMIWTDVAPAMLILCMMMFVHRFQNVESRLMFVGAVVCRLCSLAYHVFNCVSLQLNRELIRLDLFGIAGNALGVPWLCKLCKVVANDVLFCELFLPIFLCLYAACAAACLFLSPADKKYQQVQTTMLIALAVLGNVPTVYALATTTIVSDELQQTLLLGMFFLAAGYTLFYVLHVPERWMCPGSADGRWWNSHVLWHVSSALGQLAFLHATTLIDF
jgi:predicted membrane channel-forming protein YqfA (hemolysin III family)